MADDTCSCQSETFILYADACKLVLIDKFYHVFFFNKISTLTSVWKFCFVLSTEALVFQRLLCHLKLLHNCIVKTIPFAFVWVGHVAAPGQQTAIATLSSNSTVTVHCTAKHILFINSRMRSVITLLFLKVYIYRLVGWSSTSLFSTNTAISERD